MDPPCIGETKPIDSLISDQLAAFMRGSIADFFSMIRTDRVPDPSLLSAIAFAFAAFTLSDKPIDRRSFRSDPNQNIARNRVFMER